MTSIVVHYQEIALKGKNRPWFLARLVRNLRTAVSDLDVTSVRVLMGRIELVLGPSADRELQQGRGALFAALAHTRRTFALPLAPFEDLLSAFRQDVTRTRYETWDEVFDYCRRSANPVGRLVLRLFRYDDPTLDRQSDAVCTALQLTNFWQDFAIDWSRGRLYLPAEEWRPFGGSPADLDARRMSGAWRDALAAAGVRTRGLFEEGRPVADGVSGRLRFELRATWLGGVRILDRLERSGFDVFRDRPSLGLRDGLVIALSTALWRRR